MKKLYALVLGFLILLLAGCSTQNINKNQTIKVGVMAPLSGPLSSKGEAFKNGILLAEQKFKNNKDIEFIFEDHQYDPTLAVSVFHKLVDVDRVDMILNRGEPTSQAIAPLVNEYKIPTIALVINDEVTKGNPYLFRLYDPSKSLMKPLVEYARDQGYKKIALIETENTFLQDVGDQVLNWAQDYGLDVELLDIFPRGEPNFQTTILKIQEGGYDAIACFLGTTSISQFHKQMKEMGLSLPILGTDFYEDPSEIEAANGTIEGAIYTSYGVDDSFWNEFVSSFYDERQIPTASFTYDAAKMILEVIDFSSKETILNSLRSINGFVGSQGIYTFIDDNDDKYFSHPVLLKTILNGKITNY